MRKLIGRAGPLLIFAPSRLAEDGSREAEPLAPAQPQPGDGAREEVMAGTGPQRAAAAPTLAEKLEMALAGTFGRRRDTSAAVEDLWDPAGVPGPLEVAIASRAQRVAWRLWAGGRR